MHNQCIIKLRYHPYMMFSYCSPMVVGGGVSSNPEARSNEGRFHVQNLIPNADHGRESRKAQQGGNGPIDQHAKLRESHNLHSIFTKSSRMLRLRQTLDPRQLNGLSGTQHRRSNSADSCSQEQTWKSDFTTNDLDLPYLTV